MSDWLRKEGGRRGGTGKRGRKEGRYARAATSSRSEKLHTSNILRSERGIQMERNSDSDERTHAPSYPIDLLPAVRRSTVRLSPS